MKFSVKALSRDNNEVIVGFKDQIDHLRSENKNLSKRLEKNLKDGQKKLEEERNTHMETKQS